MRYQEWRVAAPSRAAREELEQAGVPPLLAAVLSARGIRTQEEAQALLAPGETPLEDPMGLRDMDRAVRRIRRALETGRLWRSMGTTTWTGSPLPVCSPTA